MKKLLLAIIIISSFLFSQSLTKGWYNESFEVPDKLTTDELEVLGGTPGAGKVLTDDGTGAGIAIWISGLTDPMTTRGDIIYRNPSNVTARLGLGANKYILQSDGTDLTWSEFLASEMNIVDGGGIIAATEVEAALQENRVALDLNTTHRGLSNNPHTVTLPQVGGANTALSNLASVAINQPLLLGTSDAHALGSITKMWADLFLASGSVINWNNGDVTLTHSANLLTIGGGNVYIDGELTLGTDARFPILGQTTGGNIWRATLLLITGVTDATQVQCQTNWRYNSTSLNIETVDTDSPAGGTRFDISADGYTITIKGLTPTVTNSILASPGRSNTGTAYTWLVTEPGNILTISAFDASSGAEIDFSAITNNETLGCSIIYITSD